MSYFDSRKCASEVVDHSNFDMQCPPLAHRDPIRFHAMVDFSLIKSYDSYRSNSRTIVYSSQAPAIFWAGGNNKS